MARTDKQRERSQYRKDQRTLEHTHGGFYGGSILEKITQALDDSVEKYLLAKNDSKVSDAATGICRGEVRGLARALVIFAVPTYRNIKQCEQMAVRRVKEKLDAQERATEEEERQGRGEGEEREEDG